MIRVWMADDDAQEARVVAVGQPGDTRKRNILAVRGRYGPAHIQDKALSTSL